MLTPFWVRGDRYLRALQWYWHLWGLNIEADTIALMDYLALDFSSIRRNEISRESELKNVVNSCETESWCWARLLKSGRRTPRLNNAPTGRSGSVRIGGCDQSGRSVRRNDAIIFTSRHEYWDQSIVQIIAITCCVILYGGDNRVVSHSNLVIFSK